MTDTAIILRALQTERDYITEECTRVHGPYLAERKSLLVRLNEAIGEKIIVMLEELETTDEPSYGRRA